MKLTYTADRIKLQAENERESQQICDLIAKLFTDKFVMSDEIANDHGNKKGLNFVTLPLPAVTHTSNDWSDFNGFLMRRSITEATK